MEKKTSDKSRVPVTCEYDSSVLKVKKEKCTALQVTPGFPQLPKLSGFLLSKCGVSTYLAMLVHINCAFPYL